MNMTVTKKMILLISAAILGLAGLAWLGQDRMDLVYEKTNYANINSVPSIVVLANAGESLGRLRIRVYRHVLNTDAAKMSEIETTIKEAQDGVEKALKGYESLISDDRDKQMLDDDRAAYNDYLKGVEKTLNLSRENKNEQARDVLMQNAAVAEKANATFKTHMDYNIDLAKKAATIASETKDAAASEEQSSGVGQINTAMDQLNKITQQNASSSEQLAATSEEMSGQVMQLQDLIAFFTVNHSMGTAVKTPKVKPLKQPVKKAAATKRAINEVEFVNF